MTQSSNDDRALRYSEAIWPTGGEVPQHSGSVLRVMAVADREQAELREELELWQTLVFINGDADDPDLKQRAAHARAGRYKRELTELQDEAARLRATLAQVEALAEDAERVTGARTFALSLRAALKGASGE